MGGAGSAGASGSWGTGWRRAGRTVSRGTPKTLSKVTGMAGVGEGPVGVGSGWVAAGTVGGDGVMPPRAVARAWLAWN